MQKLLAATPLSAAVFSAPAYAQTAQPTDRAAPAATAGSQEKMMLKGNWRASKLMGLDVYNEANEKLGDVNELILDKNGKRITDKDPRYNRIIKDLEGRRIGAQHGAHVEWKPKTDFEKKIYDDIIERHKTKEPLYEFREDGSIWETFAD